MSRKQEELPLGHTYRTVPTDFNSGANQVYPVRKAVEAEMEKNTVFYPNLNASSRDMDDTVPEKVSLLTPRDRVTVVTTSSQDDELGGTKSETSVLVPKDRGNMVYFILLVHGIGVLLSWNVLINAAMYFIGYKFAPPAGFNGTTTYANSSDNHTIAPPAVDANFHYREGFISKLSLAAQVPNLLLNAVNLFVGIGGSLQTRVVGGIIILILIMSETLVFAILDTTSWTGAFYVITMVSVVIVNAAGGVYQNSLYGLAATLPSKYTNAIIIGNNLCGTFIASLNLLSVLMFPDDWWGQAICYFTIAVVILLVALATYFLLPSSKFYRYHTVKAATPVIVKSDDRRSFGKHFQDIVTVFKQIWLQCWNVFFVFFVTLACFPGILLNIKRVTAEEKPWMGAVPHGSDRMFTDIYCFLFFNLFAFIGNLIPFVFSRPGPRWVGIPVFLRVLLIPFFLMCKYLPEKRERAYPVVINDNVVYILGVVLLGLTSGYFSSLCMTYAPKSVKNPRLSPLAGQMAAFFLVLGISVGLLFGALFPEVVLV